MPLYDSGRVRSALTESGCAALLATTPQNVLYLTRFRKAGGSLALVTAQDVDRPSLVIPAANIDFVLEDPDESVEVVPYGRFYRSFARERELSERDEIVRRLHESIRWGQDLRTVAVAVLESAGLASGAVAVDAHSDTSVALQEALPNLKVAVEPSIFSRLRMVKAPEEIERLSRAAEITEEAIAASVRAIGVGASQVDIAAAYRQAVVAEEADIRADNVSIDEGAALGNVNTPADRVRQGSVVRYDVGAIYRGYASDIARCFSVGEPHERVARYYAAVLRGQEVALEILRPGIRASELFDAAVAAVRKEGIPHYERTNVGHGIGIAGGYDAPLLAPGDDTVLGPGMVLCVETPYYEVGGFGVHVEDMVVVTEDGFDFLSHSSRHLEVVG